MIQIKWYYAALFFLLALTYIFSQYRLNLESQRSNEIIKTLQRKTDSLAKITSISVIEYKDRIIPSRTIVERWNTLNSIDTITNIDTLYLQAKSDINYLDTSLKKCDTALNNCLAYTITQQGLIKALELKKRPFPIGLGATLGVGAGTNGGGIAPHVGMTFGITFKK